MNPNLGNLFSGKFYIHKGYALSLVPTLLQSFVGVAFVEKSLDDLTTKAVSNYENDLIASDKKTCVVLSFNQPVLKYSDYWAGWLGTQAYIKILEQYRTDDSIAGVVMNVDSGGGQVYGTPEFYEYIKMFAETRPLVVYTGGLLCSGAYYFSAGASWIVAHHRADAIGSIGVYTILVNYNGLWEKLGAKIHTIYSSKSSKKNKAYRDVMDENDPAYKQYIKEELDPIAETFIADMKAVRPQIKEEVFEGGTWTGDKAVEMGLADENGTLDTAIAKVYELASQNESNSNKNNSKNQKKTMSKNTKSFPVIQKLIGVEGEGLPTLTKTISGDVGVKISEEQLETIETELAGKEEAVTAANGKVTVAEGKVTAFEGAVNAAITAAGLDADVEANATIENKLTLLSTKVVELGKVPGAKGSKPKAEGDTNEEDDAEASTSIFESVTK